MLRYVAERFELNTEQRYWLAFLYACTLSAPTAFYILHEFPDFELIDQERLRRWWDSNKQRLLFHSDRRWMRARDHFPDVVESYRGNVGRLKQEHLFQSFLTPNPRTTYERAAADMSRVYQFGRLSMFPYLEAVSELTGFPMDPPSLDMREAVGVRGGLALAIGRPDLGCAAGRRLTLQETGYLQGQYEMLVSRMKSIDRRNTVWSLKTTLCAYEKYRFGKRWVGFYLDAQAEELKTMQEAVSEGVNWTVLWNYRKETYRKKMLSELR